MHVNLTFNAGMFLSPVLSFVVSLGTLFLSPVNDVEGGYRNSQRPSVRPKKSPLTATIFH